jgi:hypothetical protein
LQPKVSRFFVHLETSTFVHLTGGTLHSTPGPNTKHTNDMRASIVVLAAALGLADAAVNGLSPFAALSRRQGEAFDPDEGSGFGDSCADAFGEGSVECVPRSGSTAPLCIEPGIGQTCCDKQCMLTQRLQAQPKY